MNTNDNTQKIANTLTKMKMCFAFFFFCDRTVETWRKSTRWDSNSGTPEVQLHHMSTRSAHKAIAADNENKKFLKLQK